MKAWCFLRLFFQLSKDFILTISRKMKRKEQPIIKDKPAKLLDASSSCFITTKQGTKKASGLKENHYSDGTHYDNDDSDEGW